MNDRRLDSGPDLAALAESLGRLDAWQAEATAALAEAASSAGGLDAHQAAAYELAFAAAEIAAFRALLCNRDAVVGDKRLLTGLAATYAGSVLPQTAVRLASVLAWTRGDAASASTGGLDPVLWAAGDPRHAASFGEYLLASGSAYRRIATGEEADLARESFWRFGQDVVAPRAEAIHRRDLDIGADILEPLRAMGVFGLAIPESYGGLVPEEGGNSAIMLAITEALSAASLGAAGSLITRPEILARALLAGGTEEQKSHWLPLIAAGDPLCAISITEPDHGSDVSGLSLRAQKVDGGWRLSGAKTWCTFAGQAGVLMVVARTGEGEGHRGLSLFLVEKDPVEGHGFRVEQPGGGVMTGKAIATIGYRGMHSFDMAYDEFFVPDRNLVGGEAGRGQGFYLTMAGMVGGRMQTAARACGVMIAAIDAAMAQVRDRKVFGAALADYQLVRVRVAQMAARLAACRALAYEVAGRVDAGSGAVAASLAKLIACRSAELVTRDAQQLFGGLGYAEESAISRYFLDARVLSIFEGAEETLALKVIARALVDTRRGAAAPSAAA